MRHLPSETRTTVVLPLLATGILSALLLCSESAANGDWHTSWRRVRLSAAQETKAKQDMKTVIEWPGTAKYRAVQLTKKTDTDRYEPLSFAEKKYGARYGPLCRLELAQMKQGANLDPAKPRTSESNFCSCSFVRPDVLMTAAHCFLPPDDNWHKGANEGRALDVRPATGWLVYVVQAYGGEAPGMFAEYTLEHAQVVVEWWTPAKFTGNEADVAKNGHADVAFAKVRNQNAAQAKRPVYELRTLMGKPPAASVYYNMFGKDALLMQLGYPGAYMDSEMPVSISGKVWRCDLRRSTDGDEVAFYGQTKKEAKKPAEQKDEASACSAIVGSMGGGGSGGPLIVANANVGERGKDLLYMATFGVQSACKKDSDNDQERKCTYARIQPEMVEALDQIAKLKLNFAAPQKIAGLAKAVTTADEGVEMVEIELPKAAAEKAKKAKTT